MDNYATHIPVLQQLGKGVKHVLELGSGFYSTPTFLDKTYYPDLVFLRSIEHDRTWYCNVRDAYLDMRLQILHIPEPFEDFLSSVALSCYDLIFVDNSENWEVRVETIKFLAKAKIGNAQVVIHDFEYEPYRLAAEPFPHRVVYNTLTPHTAVCWRSRDTESLHCNEHL